MSVPKTLLDAHFDHITEREGDGTWEDCTWCAGLEWYRITHDHTRPSTHAEAEALRAASGEPKTGGSNQYDFLRGVKERYGKTIGQPIEGFANLRAALQPGWAASVQGSMSAFGSAHRLSTWDRNFDSPHCVMIANVGGVLYWCDPEAPDSANVPVVVTWDEVSLFVKAFAGQHLVAPIIVEKEDDMEPLVMYLPGYSANIKGGSNVRSAPHIGATKFRTTPVDTKEPITLIGTVKGDTDPGNQSTEWYVWWKNGRFEYTAADNVVDIKNPAGDDGYTKATQDAAVRAAVEPLNSRIAALQPAADLGNQLVQLVKKASA